MEHGQYGPMRDARVKSNPGWCPAKAAPGGRLLRTFPCWPSLGWPRAGHPQTCSKKLLSSGYQCRPGSSMTSNLPSFPQLLHTAAHAVLSREKAYWSKLPQLRFLGHLHQFPPPQSTWLSTLVPCAVKGLFRRFLGLAFCTSGRLVFPKLGSTEVLPPHHLRS